MPEYDLKLAVQKIRTKRLNFALYRGADKDQVLITAKPPSSKQIKELEEDCGDAKRLTKGVVFYENSELVFATKSTPSPSWEKMMIAVFKERQCAKFLPLTLRQLASTESDEVEEEESQGEGEPQTSGTPTAPVTQAPPEGTPVLTGEELSAAWLQLKAAMTPRIKTAVGANPPNRAEIMGKLKEGIDYEKAGDFQSAINAFHQIEALLPAPAPAATPTTPETPAPETAPAPKLPSSADLLAALNKLTPAIKEAIAANPTLRETILQPVAAFQGQIKSGDLAAAKDSLLKVGALLKQARSSTPETPVAPGTAPETTSTNAPESEEAEAAETEGEEDSGTSEADWNKAFGVIEPLYLQFLGTQPAAATRLRALMGAASDLAGEGKYEEALDALTTLENALEAAAEEGGTETGASYSGLVAYRKTLLGFNTALNTVNNQIDALKNAIPSQMPAEAALANDLAEELQSLSSDLRRAADAAMNQAENLESPVTKAFAKTLSAYIAEVNANALIQHADNNTFGVKVTIQQTLGNALMAIEESLPTVA